MVSIGSYHNTILLQYALSFYPIVRQYRLSGTEGTIESPNYPSNYGFMKNYYWTIIAPEGKAIELITNELRIEGERNCLKDFLKIYDGESTSSPVLRIYCGIMNPYPFKSSGPEMYLHFRSDDEIDERGFRIAWKAVDVITTTASTTTQGDSEPEGQCRVF